MVMLCYCCHVNVISVVLLLLVCLLLSFRFGLFLLPLVTFLPYCLMCHFDNFVDNVVYVVTGLLFFCLVALKKPGRVWRFLVRYI